MESLWNKIMERGRADGKPRMNSEQWQTITDTFRGAERGWQVQVQRDLRVYPLFDALAMWVRESDYLLENGYIKRRTYERVQELGRKYVQGRL